MAAPSKALERTVYQAKKRAPKCQLVGPKGDSIPLSESVFFVLERVAEVMARGDSITVVPVAAVPGSVARRWAHLVPQTGKHLSRGVRDGVRALVAAIQNDVKDRPHRERCECFVRVLLERCLASTLLT